MGYYGTCKVCVSRARKAIYAKSPAYELVKDAKRRALKGGLAFDLDEHIEELSVRMVKGCELSGTPLRLEKNGKRYADSPSLDRRDATKGYVLANVRVVCWALNTAFGNWGEEQFAKIATAWMERRK